MGSGKGGDSGAVNQEVDILNKEYQENQLEEKEKTQELNKEEMGFLHSMGGERYETAADVTPSTPTNPADVT